MVFGLLKDISDAIGAIENPIPEIMNNYRESDDNRQRASDSAGAAEQEWSGDRSHINNEFARVSQGFDGEFAPATATMEAFKTWSHKAIWEALNGNSEHSGVESADVNAGADGWRRLTEELFVGLDTFGTNIERIISEQWGGEAGTAALEGTRTFVTDAQKLVQSCEMVANGIDLMQGYLAQTKMSIVPPVEVSGFDEFIGHIPGNGVIKAAKHRANEAQAQAQDLMLEFYQPGVRTVDSKTPVLPVTKSPVGGNPTQPPVGPGDTGNPNGTTNPNSTNPSGTDPAGTNPDDTTPGEETPQDQSTNPAGVETPASTTPSTTTPASTVPLEEPVGRPNTTTAGTPSTTGAPVPGTPGGQPPTGAPGRTVNGTPGGTNPAGAPAARTGNPAGTRGMSGMPGMMGAGAGRGGRGQDDDEHTTPDYLVQDRSTELLGEQPRVLPPGGVIGA